MEKQFAIIYFPLENIYSEVPSNWLTPDRKHCWWPNSLNARGLMIRGEIPDKALWKIHEVRVETYASTLESARKKAENPDYLTGGEEIITEKRIRSAKINSSSSESLITPPPSPKFSRKKFSKKAEERIKLAMEESQPNHSVAGSENCVETFQNDSPINTTEKTSTCSCKENQRTEELLMAVEKLSVSCNNIQKYVVSIDNRLKAMMSEQGKIMVDELMISVSNHLPMKTVEDVPKFDTLIAESTEMKNTYVHYIKQIGGRDSKDHINRCLPKLFTNDLGKDCSYLGLRGNFKLQEYNFMKIFVDVIMVQHSSSLHEVEKYVGEWFRLSNQRLKRMEKKKI